MKILAQIKKMSVATIILSILGGVLFIGFPEQCIKYISLAVGIAFITIGIVGIVNYLVDKSSGFGLATGIIVGLIGIIICVRYKQLISLIVIVIGIFIIATGIFNLFTGIKVIRSSIFFGWVTFFLSIATVIFGIIAVTKSNELTVSIVQFVGVALLVYAVLDIISFIQVRRLVKQVKSTIESTSDLETDGTIVQETE